MRRNGVWPAFKAPKQYPGSGVEEPNLPDFNRIFEIARACGYSIGLHGSMARDVDLIAAPWTDEAVDADDLIKELCLKLEWLPCGVLENKPHGRVAIILQPKKGYSKTIDISIMPKSCTHVYGVEHDRKTYSCANPQASMTAVCIKCGFKPNPLNFV